MVWFRLAQQRLLRSTVRRLRAVRLRHAGRQAQSRHRLFWFSWHAGPADRRCCLQGNSPLSFHPCRTPCNLTVQSSRRAFCTRLISGVRLHKNLGWLFARSNVLASRRATAVALFSASPPACARLRNASCASIFQPSLVPGSHGTQAQLIRSVACKALAAIVPSMSHIVHPNNSIKPTWLRHAAYFRR
jgi:hypothetical protein